MKQILPIVFLLLGILFQAFSIQENTDYAFMEFDNPDHCNQPDLGGSLVLNGHKCPGGYFRKYKFVVAELLLYQCCFGKDKLNIPVH